MARPQFSIRALLWLTLIVAAFFGGIGFEKRRASRKQRQPPNASIYGTFQKDFVSPMPAD